MQIKSGPSGPKVTLTPGLIRLGVASPAGGELVAEPNANAVYTLDCNAVAAPIAFSPAEPDGRPAQEGDLITLLLEGELRSALTFGGYTVPPSGSAETVQAIQVTRSGGAWVPTLAFVLGVVGGGGGGATYFSGPVAGAPDATLAEIARIEVEIAVDNAQIQWDTSHSVNAPFSTAWVEIIELVERGTNTVVDTLFDNTGKALDFDGPANWYLTMQGAKELTGVNAGSYDMRIRGSSAAGVATPCPGSARFTVLP